MLPSQISKCPLTHLNLGQDQLKLGVMGVSDVVGLVGLMCLSSVCGFLEILMVQKYIQNAKHAQKNEVKTSERG